MTFAEAYELVNPSKPATKPAVARKPAAVSKARTTRRRCCKSCSQCRRDSYGVYDGNNDWICKLSGEYVRLSDAACR